MPAISKQKKDRISEQILHHLFSISPESAFTNAISKEIARDEEFTKFLLTDLQSKKLVIEINKNSAGVSYTRRQRWRLSNQAYDVYQKHQSTSQQPSLNLKL
ncbi:MAG: hypothetical protein Q8L29_01725 [archaeon]|nr:hypothetical protein [archaeon]